MVESQIISMPWMEIPWMGWDRITHNWACFYRMAKHCKHESTIHSLEGATDRPATWRLAIESEAEGSELRTAVNCSREIRESKWPSDPPNLTSTSHRPEIVSSKTLARRSKVTKDRKRRIPRMPRRKSYRVTCTSPMDPVACLTIYLASIIHWTKPNSPK